MPVSQALPDKRLPRLNLLFAALALLFFISACSPIGGRGQDVVQDKSNFLVSGHFIGQTLTSTYAGLTGFRFYLVPREAGDGKILLSLYPSVKKEKLLAQASMPLAQVSQANFYAFQFSPIADSYLSSYYLELTVEGSGTVNIAIGYQNTYLDGSLYTDLQPNPYQLTFLPLYALKLAILGIAQEAVHWVGWLLALAFLILPGSALLRILAGDWYVRQPAGSRIALTAAAGLALYPILFLFAYLLKLSVGVFLAFIPGCLGGLYFLTLAWKQRGEIKKYRWARPAAADIAYLVAVLAIIFVRFWSVRTLALPLFGDSVHHTMIARLIIQNGGLFDSWQPWAEMQSFTYHFGLHTLIACLHWLTNLDPAQATLIMGQLLNILAVLALYPLALKVSGGSRWAGVFAILIAGALSPMPMFYTNWGRYTQLNGQVLLLGAMLLFWELFETQKPGWKLTLITGLIWGGLALTHYRVTIFATLSIPGLVLLYSGRPFRSGWTLRSVWRELWPRFRWMAGAGLLAGLIFLPWFWHIYGGGIFRAVSLQFTTPVAALNPDTLEANTPGPITGYLPMLVWLAMPIATAWGLWRRNREMLSVAIWTLAILLSANPAWFNLPGTNALPNFAIFIMAYVFAACLVGPAAAWIAEWIERSARLIGSLALILLVAATSVFGGVQRLHDIQPINFAMASWPDLRAAEWIRANTPADARFLVNAYLAYNDAMLVATDSGMWLDQIAGRKTTQPLMLYAYEKPPYPGYVAGYNQLVKTIQDKGWSAPETIQALLDRGVHYAFIGQRGGHANYGGPIAMDGAQMTASGRWKTIYHQDLVWVLELQP